MRVNEDAEGIRPLRDRIRALELALRPFVAPSMGYQSGVGARGKRWCAPRVSAEDMDRARLALDGRLALLASQPDRGPTSTEEAPDAA